MSILRGNLIAKSSFNLQSSLNLLPWLKRNCCVRCSKDRQYGSSMPVRYIPKKLREAKKIDSFSESETPSLNLPPKPKSYDKLVSSDSKSFSQEMMDFDMHTNTSSIKSFNNLHVGKKSDVNEQMGYDMGSIDSEIMEEFEEIDEELEDGNLTARGEGKLKESETRTDAEKMAVKLLAARAFSAMELRKKLLAKRFPSNIIDAVLCDFQERGLLNDSLYAEAYSRSRWSSSCWGPRRIKQALYNKGVHKVDAEKALKTVFEDGEEGDQNSKLNISKSSLDQLYLQASKQWLKSQDAPRDTRKGRMIRWLQYRGFDWGIVSVVLKKLESQYPP